MDKLQVIVFTPDGKKYDGEVEFLQLQSSNTYLGILPNHSPLISDVVISKCLLRINSKDESFAIGNGMISVENKVAKLLVDSFEAREEIDLERALKAKERAEARLNGELDAHKEIDVERAKASLARALNRISILD